MLGSLTRRSHFLSIHFGPFSHAQKTTTVRNLAVGAKVPLQTALAFPLPLPERVYTPRATLWRSLCSSPSIARLPASNPRPPLRSAATRCAAPRSAITFAVRSAITARIVVVARRSRNTSPQHARGAKRAQEDRQQPLPDVSTVCEGADQGRESCENRANHSENRH